MYTRSIIQFHISKFTEKMAFFIISIDSLYLQESVVQRKKNSNPDKSSFFSKNWLWKPKNCNVTVIFAHDCLGKFLSCRYLFLLSYFLCITSKFAALLDFSVKIYNQNPVSRGYSQFHMYMCVFICVFIYLCHTSWQNEKRYCSELR